MAEDKSNFFSSDNRPKYFLMFPKPEEKMIITPKKKEHLRYIFEGPQTFEAKENEFIHKLREKCTKKYAKSNKELEAHVVGMNDGQQLRWGHTFDHLDVDKSLSAIKENFISMAKIPKGMTLEITTMLQHGAFYSFGRDAHYRPIWVLRMISAIDLVKKYTATKVKNMLNCFFNQLLNKMTIQGQVENWVSIYDFDGCTKKHHDSKIKEIFKIIDELNASYCTRAYRNYWFNFANELKNIALMKMKTEKQQIQIIHLTKSSHNMMWDHMNQEQVEKKFGGFQEDLTANWWPPKCPSENFHSINGPVAPIISEEEYVRRAEMNEQEGYRISKKLIDGYKNPPPVAEVQDTPNVEEPKEEVVVAPVPVEEPKEEVVEAPVEVEEVKEEEKVEEVKDGEVVEAQEEKNEEEPVEAEKDAKQEGTTDFCDEMNEGVLLSEAYDAFNTSKNAEISNAGHSLDNGGKRFLEGKVQVLDECEKQAMANDWKLERVRQLKAEFDTLDKDESGGISKAELHQKSTEMTERLSKLAIVITFRGQDENQDNKLSFEEFCNMATTESLKN